MRALWLIVGLGCACATPVAACDFHMSGLFGDSAMMSGYETAEDLQARRAALYAERELAMEQARQSFLARFDIKADEAPKQRVVSAPSSPLSLPTDADPSPQAYPQDR